MHPIPSAIALTPSLDLVQFVASSSPNLIHFAFSSTCLLHACLGLLAFAAHSLRTSLPFLKHYHTSFYPRFHTTLLFSQYLKVFSSKLDLMVNYVLTLLPQFFWFCLQEGVTRLLWDNRGLNIFTGCTDGICRQWNARTGELINTFVGHSDQILDISLSKLVQVLITFWLHLKLTELKLSRTAGWRGG